MVYTRRWCLIHFLINVTSPKKKIVLLMLNAEVILLRQSILILLPYHSNYKKCKCYWLKYYLIISIFQLPWIFLGLLWQRWRFTVQPQRLPVLDVWRGPRRLEQQLRQLLPRRLVVPVVSRQQPQWILHQWGFHLWLRQRRRVVPLTRALLRDETHGDEN